MVFQYHSCQKFDAILRKATNCAFLILAMSSENDRGTCLVGLLRIANYGLKHATRNPQLLLKRRKPSFFSLATRSLRSLDPHGRRQTFCPADMAGQKQYAPEGHRQFICWCVHQRIRSFVCVSLCGSVANKCIFTVNFHELGWQAPWHEG